MKMAQGTTKRNCRLTVTASSNHPVLLVELDFRPDGSSQRESVTWELSPGKLDYNTVADVVRSAECRAEDLIETLFGNLGGDVIDWSE
jgi:hypothetical protein